MAEKIELQKVSTREKLAPRREPYWYHLGANQSLGFRKQTANSFGTWQARFYNPTTGKKLYHSVGEFENLPASERFDAARKAAMQWLTHMAGGGSAEMQTVAQACSAYAKHIEGTSGKTKADDIRARYGRWIDTDLLGAVALDKLKRDHIRAWRRRLESAPIINKSSGKTRKRSHSTNNRDMTALRTALNHALAEGLVSSDFAWAIPLKPTTSAGGRRTLYLSLDQRRALVAHAAPDVALFIKGLCALPLRSGALASLTVSNFDSIHGALRIDSDKAGAGRSIKLPPDTITLLAMCSKDKLPGAPLFCRADGKPWDKDAWKGPIKEAARASGLDNSTCAYTLRHSTITDLVTSGLDLATVATLAGTSVQMIAKHYAHLQQDRAADALAGLTL